MVMRTDPMLQDRQVGMIDAHGNSASFSGTRTFDWSGGRVGTAGMPGGRLGGKGEVPPLSDQENTSRLSHLARIVTNEVTKIINVPVLSNSERNGLAGCLYNVTIPNIDNFRRFGVPPDYGASSIPEIYSNPHIGPKVVLNIMDGLLAEYAGGPLSQPNYAIQFDTIYASRDPVAIDSVAGRQIETWRKREKFPSIARTGAHIAIAAQMGLGNASPSRIEVRNVGR